MATTVQVTFDCHDPDTLARFWCEVLGYHLPAPPGVTLEPGTDPRAAWNEFLEAHGVPPEHRNDSSACQDPDGVGPRLYFQKVPEDKVVKNRLHLDVRAAPGLRDDERMAALEAACARLVGHGATRLRRVEADAMEQGFIVMADPEGNEFCLD
jgi:catechol 2,3-dioxygenase-like lactoylglutathione lyase family enzyme